MELIFNNSRMLLMWLIFTQTRKFNVLIKSGFYNNEKWAEQPTGASSFLFSHVCTTEVLILK